jgi:hypothetical protein
MISIVEGSRGRSTDREAMDRDLGTLARRKGAWVREGLPSRLAYLRRLIDGVLEVAPEWVDEACRRKGIDRASALSGEEWVSGPMTVIRGLHLLTLSLRRGGRPRPPALRRTPGGQTVARVFPATTVDRFLYYDMSAEVWLEPGKPPTQGRIYRDKEAGIHGPGRVALVLGAGNVSSITPLDVAYKLFVEDQVVVLKMNPVNDYLGPLFERAFAALIEDGYLALAYGDKEVGEYLCRHPSVETIHLTGSHRTHDAIVWGGDAAEQDRRKRENRPRVDKPVTAELGCVTPVIVVPGRWSAPALEFQARNVAAMVTHNASFNCNAGKVLVLPTGWAQRERFLERLRAALAAVPARRAYYPGAEQRYRTFRERYPQSEALVEAGEGSLPWTLVPDVPPEPGEHALTEEAFCGILAEVSLDAADAAAFLERAVDFVNESVWGSLSCVILADAATQRAEPKAVENAIARLRYGGVGLNVWTGVNFALGVTSWGAFPGQTARDIGSGCGVVHNSFLFDHPQKSVVRSRFRVWPKPVWFPDHRTLDAVGGHLTRFEATRSIADLARVAYAGLWG